MIEFYNKATFEINLDFIQSIADSLTSKNIELIITDSKEMKEINFTHRNINKDTDVLSFPYEEMPMCPLGSIIICKDYVLENQKNFLTLQMMNLDYYLFTDYFICWATIMK